MMFMHKMGRNDRCHCGSGKKYKKCCLDIDQLHQDQQNTSKIVNLLSYEEVDTFHTDEIIEQLNDLGIPFNNKQFLQDVEFYTSADEISEHWFQDYSLEITGRMEDFPWFAAWVLWVRLAPSENLSLEQISDLLMSGYEHMENDDTCAACDVFFNVWEALKYRFDPTQKDLSYIDEQYRADFNVSNFVQDFDMALGVAGIRDSEYFIKRIAYCREFIHYFPKDSSLVVHNMRRSIADSYSKLTRYDEAEEEFRQIVKDYPHNPWSYIGWADMLFMDKEDQLGHAKELYKKALDLTVGEYKYDKETIEDRLADLATLIQ